MRNDIRPSAITLASVWDHSAYSKNRDRLLEADVAKKFLKAILAHQVVAPLLSDDHFTVDGTMVQAFASMKCFLPKDAPDGSSPPPPSEAGSPPTATEPPTDQRRSGAEAAPAAAEPAPPAKPSTPPPQED